MKHSPLATRALAVLFLIAASFASGAQEYEIRLDVPSKVGDKMRLRVTGGETNQFNVTQNGGVLQKRASRQTWNLDGHQRNS